MTRQVTDQLYIELEYFNPEEYYTYIAEANADAGALFTPSITVGAQVNQTATLDCVSTMSITVEKVVGVAVAMTATFTQTTNTGETLEAAAALTATFTQSVDAVANRSAQSTLDSIVNLSLQSIRIQQLSSSLASEYGLSAVGSGTFIRSADASLSVNSSASISPVDWGDGFTPFTPYNGAVIVGSPTKFGSGALYLPNNTSYAETNSVKWDFLDASSATQSIGCQGRFGIAMWLYPTATPGSGTEVDIISSFTSSPDDGWYVRFNSSRQIIFGIYDNGTGERTTSGVGTLTLNQWNYVVISRSWDSTVRGRLIISINGSEYTTDGSHDWASTGSTDLRIGYTGDRNGFTGYLDSIHIIKGGWIATTVEQTSESQIRAAVTDSSYPAGLSDLSVPTVKSILVLNFNGNADDISGAGVVEYNAALSAAATLSAQPGVFYANNPADVAAAFSQAVDGVVTRSAESDLNAVAALSATALRTKSLAADLSATASLTADVDLIAQAVAAVSSEFAQTTTGVVTRDAAVSTDSIFTELAAVAKIGDFLITLDSQASQNTVAVKITDAVSSMSSQFAQSTDAILSVDVDSSISSEFTQATAGDRFRSTEANLVATATESATAQITAGAAANLASQFGQETTTQGIIGYSADLVAQSDLTVVGYRIKQFDSTIQSAFAVQATTLNSLIRSAASTQNSQFNLNYNIELIKTAQVQTDSIFSELAAAVKTGRILADCNVSATLTTTASIIAENQIGLENTTQITTDAVKTATFNSNLAAVSSTSIEGTTNLTGEAGLTAVSAVICDADLTAAGIALVASSGTMAVTATKVKQFSSSLSVLAFELAVTDRIRLAQATITAQTTVAAQAQTVKRAQAAMSTNGAVLTLAKIIHIDPCLTYVIPAENRTYRIIAEDRTYNIIDENRTYTIKGCE